MFERFTEQARQGVINAQEEARSLDATQILPAHLLVGIVAAAEKSAPPMAALLGGYGLASTQLRSELQGQGEEHNDAAALGSLGIDLEEVRRAVDAQFGEGTLDAAGPANAPRRRRFGLGGGHIPFTAAAKAVLTSSLRESTARRDGYIGVEHLLLGLLRGADPSALALVRRHVGPDELRARILDAMDAAA
ncbi:hypothetical protein LJ754_14925 [Arthrobacter sp. zg-Y40]|uniref:Clp protease N-terminal domain-containing protein n=1 Tax=Arthrobacter sp. zg-Y40 TaxID=2886939 RepID=UPI001D15AB03|nr:Clp protease N-terminal domain-containing protein [Arthrobacter sp. zg-Y40]MCC3280442.1 hypothetical protein [Arthrobacter sp. zg-Y40]